MKAKIRYDMPPEIRKAVKEEVNKQIADNVKGLSRNFTALVLWQLREQLGWGKKRLSRFAKKFAPALRELGAYYEMPGDAAFICDYRLRNEVGIDVRELDGCLIDFVPNVK